MTFTEFRRPQDPIVSVTMSSHPLMKPSYLASEFTSTPRVAITFRQGHWGVENHIPRLLEVTHGFDLEEAREIRASLDSHIAAIEAGWTLERAQKLAADLVKKGALEAVGENYRWIDEAGNPIHGKNASWTAVEIAIRHEALEAGK